jgi:hypothetical protein
MTRHHPSRLALRQVTPPTTTSAAFSLRPTHRRPFRHEARSPQVRTRSFTAQPPHLRHFALTTGASPFSASSPRSAAPHIRFLFIGSRFTFHASSPRSVALPQLRFPSITVVSSRQDFHLQDRAHAGRTPRALTRPRWPVSAKPLSKTLVQNLSQPPGRHQRGRWVTLIREVKEGIGPKGQGGTRARKSRPPAPAQTKPARQRRPSDSSDSSDSSEFSESSEPSDLRPAHAFRLPSSPTGTSCGMCCGQFASQALTVNTIACSARAL